MKERPILFSGAMVRAILSGTKTQTRRVVKPQPPEWVKVWNGNDGVQHFFFDSEHDNDSGKHWPSYENGLRCPYGQPGDRLWVRETWGISLCGSRVPLTPEAWSEGWPPIKRLRYAADGERLGTACVRPSIHMPRWASRITLEITNVRVERLQEISNDDALAEGINRPIDARYPVDEFRALWDSINAGRGFGWNTNPWLWVLEFKRL